MSKIKEEKKEKFDVKIFKENFLKGEMYHGILVDPKEINKIKNAEKTILFKFFYHQNKLFLFYMIIQIYIIVLMKIKKYLKLIKN